MGSNVIETPSRVSQDGSVDEAQRYVDAFNAGDVEALAAMMSPEYRYVDRYAGGTVDAESHLAVIKDVHERMPDRQISVDRIVDAGGSQIVEGEWSGTPPGGATLRTHLLIILDVVDGLVASGRAYYREADLQVS